MKSLVIISIVAVSAICAAKPALWEVEGNPGYFMEKSPNGQFVSGSMYTPSGRRNFVLTPRELIVHNVNQPEMESKDVTNDGTLLISGSSDIATQPLSGAVIPLLHSDSWLAYTAMFTAGENVAISQTIGSLYTPTIVTPSGTTVFDHYGIVGNQIVSDYSEDTGQFIGRTYGGQASGYAVQNWVSQSTGTRWELEALPGFRCEAFYISSNGRYVAGTCTPHPGIMSRGIALWETNTGNLLYTASASQVFPGISDWNVRGVDNMGRIAVTSGTGIGGLYTGRRLHLPNVRGFVVVCGADERGKLMGHTVIGSKKYIWAE